MAQEYEVLQFKKGDFQDNYGNYWCDMALKGVGEPVRIAVKDPTQFQDGMTLYGSVETKTSKAGKEYMKFKREEREDDPDQQSDKPKQSDEYWEDKNSAIKAQFAIKVATEFLKNSEFISDDKLFEATEKYAKEIFAMVDRVKGSEMSKVNLHDLPETVQNSLSGHVPEPKSGYDKFKASRPNVDDAEAASLYASIAAQEN